MLKKIVSFMLIAIMTITLAMPIEVQAATVKKSVSITIKKSKTVSVPNKIKSVKSSNKKIATVKKTSSKKAKITAKKAGKTTVTIKTTKKTYKYTVTVQKSTTKTSSAKHTCSWVKKSDTKKILVKDAYDEEKLVSDIQIGDGYIAPRDWSSLGYRPKTGIEACGTPQSTMENWIYVSSKNTSGHSVNSNYVENLGWHVGVDAAVNIFRNVASNDQTSWIIGPSDKEYRIIPNKYFPHHYEIIHHPATYVNRTTTYEVCSECGKIRNKKTVDKDLPEGKTTTTIKKGITPEEAEALAVKQTEAYLAKMPGYKD